MKGYVEHVLYNLEIMCVRVVYDVTRKETFMRVRNHWIPRIVEGNERVGRTWDSVRESKGRRKGRESGMINMEERDG